MTALSISLLGSFEAALDNEPLTQFRTKSVQALFIYLVCEAKRPPNFVTEAEARGRELDLRETAESLLSEGSDS